MSTRNLFWDFDGTLCETAAEIVAAWQQAMVHCRLECPDFQRRFHIGKPLEAMLADLLPGLEAASQDALLAAFRQAYEQSGFLLTHPFPGIDALLRRTADAGLHHYIASNKRQAPTRLILAKLGWQNRFSGVYTPDMSPGEKLHKSEFLGRALRERRLAPQDCLMIGDSVGDIEAGRASGIQTAAVAWGYEPAAALQAAKPDYFFQRVDDLAEELLKNG